MMGRTAEMSSAINDKAARVLAQLRVPAGAAHVMARSVNGRQTLIVRLSPGTRVTADRMPKEIEGTPISYEIARPAKPSKVYA
jgi:hypothetical protein